MAAMTAFLAELVGAMAIIGKLSKVKKFGFSLTDKEFNSFYSLTEEIKNLAIAVGILAASCKVLGSMNFEELTKGLMAVTILLAEVASVGLILNKRGINNELARVGSTLIMISASLLILTKAVKELSSLDLTSLIKGIGSVGILMLEMAAFTKLIDGANTRKAGFALIEMAAAMGILVISIKELGSMNLEELAKGLISMGIALAEMVVAMNLMPEKKSITKALAMIEFAAAMVIIAKSLKELADLSPAGLMNAVIAMGAVILEMVIALDLMPEKKNITKAFAMIEFAAALVLISKALVPLAESDPEGLLAAVIAIGAVILEMTICLELMQSVKWANLDALAIIEMAVALVIIARSLEPLAEFEWPDLMGAVTALGSMLLILTGVLALLSGLGPMSLVAGAAAVLLGATAVLLAEAFQKFVKAIGLIKDLKLSESEKDMDAFLKFMLKLEGVLAVGGALTPLIILFSTAMTTLASALAISGIVLSKAILDFTPALTQLGTAIQTLNNIKYDNFIKNAAPLCAAITAIGLATANFGILSGIGASSFLDVAEGIGKLVDPMVKFSKLDPDKLGKAFTKIADGITQFGKSLKSFGLLSGIGASALNEVAEAVEKFAPSLITLSEVPGAKINSIMKALASGFEAFGESLDSYGLLSSWYAKALVSFGEAVKNMAEPLVLLSDVPGAKINSIMRALGAGFENFAAAIEKTPFWGAKGRSEALLNLCEGINSITESIPKLNDIDSETLLSKMTSIGNGFKKFGEALAAAPLFNSSGRAGGITDLCNSIHNLADGITYFMDTTANHKDEVESTLEAIGNSFKVFGEALDSAPLIGSSSRGEGIATLVNNIITLADGVEDFSSRDFSNFTFTTNKIAGAFKAFGEALCEAPLWGADTRGEGIATLIDSLSTLAEGIQKFIDLVDADNFDKALEKIKDAFLAFSEALDNTPWMFVEDRAAGIGAVVSNIKTLAEGVGAFKDFDFNYITLLGQLGRTLGDFGKAIDETPFWDNEGRAAAIVKVIDALSPLVDSAIKIAGQSGAIEALHGFSSAISGLGYALSTSWNNVDVDMVNTLQNTINVLKDMSTVNTSTLSAVNATIVDTIDWLKELCNLNIGDGSKINAVTNLASQFIESVRNLSPTIVVVGSSFVDSWLTGIKQKFGEASKTGTELGTKLKTALELMRTQFTSSAVILANEFLKGIKSKEAEATKTGTDFGTRIINALRDLQDEFHLVADLLADDFINGIEDHNDYATQAGIALGHAVIDSLNSLYNDFVITGRYVVEGFVQGINDNMSSAIDAGTKLGQEAYKAAQNALQVQSPSKRFSYLGKMSGQGLINGLLNQTKAVRSAGYTLGESSFDGLQSAIDSIYSYMDDNMDMNPTITPNVDMSNVRKATDETTDLFNQAISVSTDNVSGMSGRFTNFTNLQNEQLGRSISLQSKDQDNSDVVSAVNSLKTDIDGLKEAMTNIRMVLDTGTMVGAMTPMIDQQLGMRQVYAGRGM
jgi:hypothetical protein